MRKVAIRKAYISPQEYRQYLEDVNPLGGSIHSLRLQPAEYKLPAEARSLMSGENVSFRNMQRHHGNKDVEKLPLELNGTPLGGRFTYPAELFSINPHYDSKANPDIPQSYKYNRPLHLYGFEGKTTPQRYTEILQPEGIIYGDIPESDIQRITNRPINIQALRMAARALMPTHELPISSLKEKEVEAAKQLMVYGIPPMLSENVSPVTLERTPQSWEYIEDFHDPFQQWSKNQQLLNEALTDFTFPKGEPMDIALQLLKEDIDYQDEDYIYPHEQIWNDEADENLKGVTASLWNYVKNMSNDDKIEWLRLQGSPTMQRGMQRMYGDYPELSQQDIDDSIWEMMFDAWQDSQLEMPGGIDFGDTKPDGLLDPVRAHAVHPSQWKKLASEPMDMAWRLLKLEDLEDAPRPFAEFSHAELEHFQTYQDNLTPEGREALFRELQLRTKENPPLELPEHMHYDAAGDDESHPMHGLAQLDYTEFSPEFQDKLTGEPMDIAFQLLKERVSPEAKRHKLEYDKKYESSPERIKYREQLNQERRKRGIYGSHDHKDISHTEGGKLTLEGEHENRARHFSEKGTLRPN